VTFEYEEAICGIGIGIIVGIVLMWFAIKSGGIS